MSKINPKDVRQVKPEIAIVLDKPRTLRMDLNAMCAFQRETSKNLFMKETIKELTDNMNPVDLRVLLWACLLHEDESLTLNQVGAMVNTDNAAKIEEGVVRAWAGAIPEVPGDDNRPLARKRQSGTG